MTPCTEFIRCHHFLLCFGCGHVMCPY